MNIITDLLFSTSLRASFSRVVVTGIGWSLSALTGLAIFADLELPDAEWVQSTAVFVTSILATLLAHVVSLISTKFQKNEQPK